MRVLEYPADVNGMAFSRDGRALFTTDRTGKLRAWDLATGRVDVLLERAGGGALSGPILAPDGRSLAVGPIWVFVLRTGPVPPGGPPVTVRCRRIGDTLRVAPGWPLLRILPCVGSLGYAYAPGRRVLAVTLGTALNFWNLKTGRRTKELSHADQLQAFPAFRPDGRVLATVDFFHRPGSVRLWSYPGLKLLRELNDSHQPFHPRFSPDGKLLAVTSRSTVLLYHARTWTILGRLRCRSKKFINCLAFAPGGHRLLTGGKDGVRLWDVAGQCVRAEWDWNIGAVNDVAFAPDGLSVAAAGSDKKVVIWDLDEN